MAIRWTAASILFALLGRPVLAQVGDDWIRQIDSLKWVAYAAPSSNPPQGIEATREAMIADLTLLARAGFSGIVTYGTSESSGPKLIEAVRAARIKGLIVGVWDPLNRAELEAARDLSHHEEVVGYCVGNEGYPGRYDLDRLRKAVWWLGNETAKPVATSEEIGDYADEELAAVGDWIFPNAHPFWHEHIDPAAAVTWTTQQFEALSAKNPTRLVWFKEVGLPTAGRTGLSEDNQARYYSALDRSTVRFVCFEAFDQPWKTHAAVEPFWGLFAADGHPKKWVAARMPQEAMPALPVMSATRTAPGVPGGIVSRGSGVSAEDAQRIDTLLAKLTLEEKLGQLTQQWGGQVQDINPVVTSNKQNELFAVARAGKVGSFLGGRGAEYTNQLQEAALESRHKIPLLLGNDIIHGYRTIFPIPLAEAATWDVTLVKLSARIAATEARAGGTHWTFAPMVDICRDPRWGRIAEGAGEDPYLGAAMAVARVQGFQGTDLAAPDTILACTKHYAAYGAPEGGRDYNTVNLSERALREVHLPPFKAAVEAGTASLMSAFNEINGEPATGCALTLQRILREEWAFDGFIVSDWNSVGEMVTHGFCATPAHAAEVAIRLGIDMDMSSFLYRSHLGQSVRQGTMDMVTIDQAVRRVLEAKARCGLFDEPFSNPELEKQVVLSSAHRDAAREVARSSIVLLKNDGGTLPLTAAAQSIAVVGPLADSAADPLGTWKAFGEPDDVITVLDGIRQRAGSGVTIHHARGCEVKDDGTSKINEAVTAVKRSDVAIVVVGETEDQSGEGHCRTRLDLPGGQIELIKAVHATGVPTIVVLLGGRPLSVPWSAEHVPAILMTWHLGVEQGHAVADVLFGDHNPCGKLPVTVPRSVGQVPLYYAHKNTGRPPRAGERYTSQYIDAPWTPLYPFGFGLSYTQFEYTDLSTSSTSIGRSGHVQVSATVTNTGAVAGHEVVQLYIRDVVASITRPVKELRGFERIHLAPGESRRVIFDLHGRDLGFYNRNMDFVVEPGAFHVWIGPSSTDGLQGSFEVTAAR